MKIIKRIISALLLVVFCLQGVSVFAEGDPNIDNGGGNLQDGSKDNFWNPGNDGVRVTIVDSQTGLAKSSSIDYTNTNQSGIAFHFGKVCKADYLNGSTLKVSTVTIPNG